MLKSLVLSLFVSSSFSQELNASSFSQDLNASSYDWNFGNLALWHSEASYCSPSTYLTREYKGILSGFIPTYAIYDKSHGKIDLTLLISLP